MESLKLNNLLRNHCPKNIALIYGSQHGITKEVTFKTLFDTAQEIKLFLSRHIKDDSICIGLLMDKNILIPSIIISFQDLKYSFMFLTINTLSDSVSSLNIKWILSVDIDIKPSSMNFCLKETLQLADENKINLWLNNNILDDKEHLSYKDIFCVVQTSGSTGDSKIVRVPHTCIEKNVKSLNKHFGISSNDVIYWGTPLTFDPTWVELILGILYGATLLIIPNWISLNPSLLYHALFKSSSTTFLQVVPSIFLRWNKQQITDILLNSSLKMLAFGGEPFPEEILKYRRKPDLKLYNLYGVTELSCWASIADLTSRSFGSEVPLGQALDETFVQLRNEKEELISAGIAEICIGSNTRYCLINKDAEELNSPFLIKTGDLGEWKDGNLFYRGRKTRVIKRFGHRINLHKIENIILNETGLQSRLVYSVCHKKLLAFVFIQEPFKKNTKIRVMDKLRVKLLKVLPEYAFPDFLDILTHCPLNVHGKICDKSLKKQYLKSLSESPTTERKLDDIFIDSLSGYLKIDLRDNIDQLGERTFAELGGSSILAVQFLQTFEERIGADAPGELITLLINSSIQACLKYVVQNLAFTNRMLEDVIDIKKAKLIKLDQVETRQCDCVLWKYNLKGCVDSSPVAFKRSDNTFIASGSFAHIFAIVCENGDEYLTLTLPQEVEAQPCVSNCNKFIFIGCANGSMYSIDLDRKRIAWEYPTREKIRSSSRVCGTSLIFGSYDGFFYCLRMKDGALRWKVQLVGSIRADPIYEGKSNRIYVGTTKGMCYALNEENGLLLWTCKIDSPIFGSPCIIRDCTVWPSVIGKLYCFNSAGDVKWTLKTDGNIFSSLIEHNDVIYFGCHDSYLYQLTLSDKECEISKILKLESESSSSPFVHVYEGKVFIVSVCNIGTLYVIEALSKSVVLKMQLPAQSFSSPYVFNNRVYVGCRDDNLYCIDIERALINHSSL